MGFTLENKLLDAALTYRFKHNWSVIPLSPGSKIPPKGFDVVKYRSQLPGKEEIEKWWAENPRYNIGIITGKLSNLFVIDLDKYKPEYSEETVLKYIPDDFEAPSDQSPRGGQHLYCQFPKDFNPTIHADTLPGVDYRGEGGYILAPPSIFEGKAAAWIIPPNGKPLPGAPLTFLSFLKSIINNDSTNYLYKADDTQNENCRQMSPLSSNVFNVGRRDQDLFHLANILVKGGCEPDFLMEVMKIAAKSCNPPFPESEVKIKIDSAIQRAERKSRNVSQEVEEWILSSSGRFLSSEVAKCLLLSSRDDQKNLSKVLKRFCDDGIIKRTGDRNGCFEIIEKLEENIIDLSAADNTCMSVKFPLGVHDLVKIMPKNIIIVAGESNAGKTAFLLNFAAKNMLDHKVFYFSSEMGGAELKERLINFSEKLPFELWKNCTFIERANDFDIAIRPDAINIIDFLEIHDEFYKIGGFIKKIFDKLDKGIAIIAIQKNTGRDEGLGGARSIEKARLYLSMRPGVVKIVKAKNWVSGLVNPNGLEKEYKLAKGMIFSDASNWVKSNV